MDAQRASQFLGRQGTGVQPRQRFQQALEASLQVLLGEGAEKQSVMPGFPLALPFAASPSIALLGRPPSAALLGPSAPALTLNTALTPPMRSIREPVFARCNNNSTIMENTESRSEEGGGGVLAMIPVEYHGRARIRAEREAGGEMLNLCFN